MNYHSLTSYRAMKQFYKQSQQLRYQHGVQSTNEEHSRITEENDDKRN